jgi:hypothetical protein
MAFSVTLHIEGHPNEQEGLPVVSSDFAFNQQVDSHGVPVSRVSGGIINIGLKNINDYDLMQWMMTNATKNGKIVLSSGMTDNQSFQTIKFKDGILINYHQSFTEESEIDLNLTISCREMEVAGATFTNIWGNQ